MPTVGSTDEGKSAPAPFSSRRALAAIIGSVLFALALIAIYAALWKTAPFRGTDTPDYLNAAKAIASGDMSTEQPRTPGLPLFLILVGTGRLFFFASLALHFIAVALLALVLRSAGVRAWLIGLYVFVGVLPPFVQKDAYLLTEGLFEFFMVAGVAGLWLRRKSRIQLLLSGLAFALATITRPQNQALPIVVGLLMILYFGWKQGLRFASLFVAPSILVMGGLIANNFVRYHDPNLTYNLGIHLGTRTVTLFDDIPDPLVRRIMVTSRNAAFGNPNRNIYWTTDNTRGELMQATGKSPAALAKYMLGIHLYLIRHHPLAYLEEVGRACVHFWFPDLSRLTNGLAVVALISVLTQLLLTVMFWFTFVVWAGLSIGRIFMPIPDWLPDPSLRWMFAAAMATILYTNVICTAIDMGEARYRSTLDLVILFVIIVAADFLWRSRKAGFTRPSSLLRSREESAEIPASRPGLAPAYKTSVTE